VADLTGEVIDNRYELLSLIASGGMASIYKAMDQRLDRYVAVKIMHPHLANDEEFVNRFIREAKAIAALSHPNIVQIQDQGWNEGGTPAVFIVMEFIDGFTLRDLLAEQGPLSASDVLRYMIPVVSALAQAHKLGINHRDLKPENILIAKDGRIKIADFGLARGGLLGSTMTVESSVVLGSVSYLSPEQVERGISDARSDIYSLGIVLFELLTGEKPFVGDTPIQIAFKHVNETVPAPSTLISGIPASLDAIVVKASSRNPDKRQANCSVLLDELMQVQIELDPKRSQLSLDLDIPPELPKQKRKTTREPVKVGNTLVTRVRNLTEPNFIPSGSLKNSSASKEATMSNSGAIRRKTSRRVRRNRIIAALVFILIIAGGWYVIAGPLSGISIPSVVGMKQSDAEATISALGLKFSVIGEQYDPNVPAGEILSSNPGGGGHLKKGSTVTAILSKGAMPIATPTPTPTPTPSPSPSDSSGTQTPDAQAPITINSYVGLTSDQAQSELTAAGLNVNQKFAYSDSIAAGDVISQSPDGSAPVLPGSTVTITVSQGPSTVFIPNIYSLTKVAATTELENLQLKVMVKRIGKGTHVIHVSPSVGTKVKIGSTVTITLG